ncbi:hypothetical protein GCM10027418_05170 [Mariniluteicoccus endophyticus]
MKIHDANLFDGRDVGSSCSSTHSTSAATDRSGTWAKKLGFEVFAAETPEAGAVIVLAGKVGLPTFAH